MEYTELGHDLPVIVRSCEIGADGYVRLSSLSSWLQEAAGQSANELGFGEFDLNPLGCVWILTRQILRIKRLPQMGENLRIHSWPSSPGHVMKRGYEIFDEKGECIVRSGSAWNVFNIYEHKLTSLPEDFMKSYPEQPRPCDDFFCRVIPKLKNKAGSCPVLVRRDDLDINGHVNNTNYLSWLLEIFPYVPAFGSIKREVLLPTLVDITYRAECFPHDELECEYGYLEKNEHMDFVQANVGVLHSLKRKHDGTEVCRALTLWTKDPMKTMEQ